MKVQWKKSKSIRPDRLLDRLNRSKSIRNDGRVSFDSFDYYDVFSAIFSMLKFPESVSSEIPIDHVVSKAIDRAALEGDITKETLIKNINNIVREELSTKEIRYHLLTSVSVTGDLPFKQIFFEGVKMRFVDRYPKKYSCRNDVILENNKSFLPDHAGYRKVILTVKSKSYRGASTKALDALDAIRSVFCMFANAEKELFGDQSSPVNRVRLGQVHTLHKENGSSATQGMVWYEPNFKQQRPFNIKGGTVYNKNFRFIIDGINNQPYGRDVKNALVRYVRALDDPNHNSALIQIWGALEALVSPYESNCDRISRRCSFLFYDQEYHEQIIEHLREYRNSNVHAGDQSDRAKMYCFQAQYYFKQMIYFLLRNVFEFSNLGEALEFLDMPSSRTSLEAKERILKNVFYFKRYRDVMPGY